MPTSTVLQHARPVHLSHEQSVYCSCLPCCCFAAARLLINSCKRAALSSCGSSACCLDAAFAAWLRRSDSSLAMICCLCSSVKACLALAVDIRPGTLHLCCGLLSHTQWAGASPACRIQATTSSFFATEQQSVVFPDWKYGSHIRNAENHHNSRQPFRDHSCCLQHFSSEPEKCLCTVSSASMPSALQLECKTPNLHVQVEGSKASFFVPCTAFCLH